MWSSGACAASGATRREHDGKKVQNSTDHIVVLWSVKFNANTQMWFAMFSFLVHLVNPQSSSTVALSQLRSRLRAMALPHTYQHTCSPFPGSLSYSPPEPATGQAACPAIGRFFRYNE